MSSLIALVSQFISDLGLTCQREAQIGVMIFRMENVRSALMGKYMRIDPVEKCLFGGCVDFLIATDSPVPGAMKVTLKRVQRIACIYTSELRMGEIEVGDG